MRTYQEQANKIMMAYLTGTITPHDGKYRFWGIIFEDLLDDWRYWATGREITRSFEVSNLGIETRVSWTQVQPVNAAIAQAYITRASGGMYTPEQVFDIECNFIEAFINGGQGEDALFQAVVSSLSMLRMIHEDLGEEVIIPFFEKRTNQLAEHG